jgi:hypothetical protein
MASGMTPSAPRFARAKKRRRSVVALLGCKSETIADEQRVGAPEIGVERICLAHRVHESIAKLFARHQERNDVGAVAIAGLFIVEPARLFQPRVKRVVGMACNRPIRALPLRASSMNLGIASKIARSSWSKPTIMPHQTSSP